MLTRSTHRVEDLHADPFFADERQDAPLATPEQAMHGVWQCLLGIAILVALAVAAYFA